VGNDAFMPFVCLWRKKNDKSFEYYKRTLEEMKSLFFYSLYL
jgi:hypothetical protein